MGWTSFLQPAADFIGGAWDSIDDLWGGSKQERQMDQANQDQLSLSSQNLQFQKELAKNGVRWRVEDAVAAGLHPLVGAGINPASASPVTYMPGSVDQRRDIGEGISRMGQGIARSQLAKATEDERLLNHAQIEKLKADADMSRAAAAESLARIKNMGLPPPTPVPDKYKAYKLPDGSTEMALSPDYSASIMSDPLSMWATSVKKAFGGPDTLPFWHAISRSGKSLMRPWRLNK